MVGVARRCLFSMTRDFFHSIYSNLNAGPFMQVGRHGGQCCLILVLKTSITAEVMDLPLQRRASTCRSIVRQGRSRSRCLHGPCRDGITTVSDRPLAYRESNAQDGRGIDSSSAARRASAAAVRDTLLAGAVAVT